jgi:hypothetical protein
VVLKLTPALPVGGLLLALIVRASRFGNRPDDRDHRSDAWSAAIGVLAGCLLFVFLIPASLVGWQANLRHLESWYSRVACKADHDRTDQFAGAGSTVRNQSLTNAVQRFGNWVAYKFAGGPDDRLLDQIQLPELGTMPMDRPIVHQLLVALRGVAGLMLLAAVIALGRRGDGVSLGFALGLGCVATFVASPVARGHYFLLFVPAVLFGGLWMRARGSGKAAIRFAAIPMLLCLSHYLALNYAGRIGLLGIGTSLWYFAACAIVVADAARGQRVKELEVMPVAGRTHEPTHRAAA